MGALMDTGSDIGDQASFLTGNWAIFQVAVAKRAIQTISIAQPLGLYLGWSCFNCCYLIIDDLLTQGLKALEKMKSHVPASLDESSLRFKCPSK